jgi:hypothetical protein
MYVSLDDSHLLDQRYNNPMCFLQRYTFIMYFIQRLKPQWGEWGIKGCSEYMGNLQRYNYQFVLCNFPPQQGQGRRQEGCLALNILILNIRMHSLESGNSLDTHKGIFLT